jgi:hypothetical protein
VHFSSIHSFVNEYWQRQILLLIVVQSYFMTENKPVDKTKASKLANMLEDLDFPADKPKILFHVNQRFSSGKIQDNGLISILQNNLTDNKQYENVYEIEKQAGLVTQEKAGELKRLDHDVKWPQT